ncbi:hypothetical protein Acr_00g0011030 [Actinidia rufa]|uniref:CCHC-type domain-containing protein n=1 Tax=Actinidia rufa TaxID=165716 RepID=A0A7J0DB57_9ERIC|nr:hypothetical protein Acr_00g0011030 [Actinidia rufa]
MGSIDQNESQALVLERSRERGRGQGRGHHRGIGKGWWRSQARGRTVRCFYCDQEGHIKRDCPKYKAQDQYLDTAATAVMAVDEDEIDVLLTTLDDRKLDWILDSGSELLAEGQSGSAWQMGVEELSEFPRDQGIQGDAEEGGLRRLEGYIGGVSRQGELLSDMGPVVLARRMDKGRNRCTRVVCTREERWSHDISQSDVLCGAPRCGVWGTLVEGAGHLGEKVQALRCGGVYTSVGTSVRRLDALQSYGGSYLGWTHLIWITLVGGAGDQKLSENTTYRLPSSG